MKEREEAELEANRVAAQDEARRKAAEQEEMVRGTVIECKKDSHIAKHSVPIVRTRGLVVGYWWLRRQHLQCQERCQHLVCFTKNQQRLH